MTNVPSERDMTVRRVMKSLARLRAHGDVTLVRNDRAVSPVLVVLPSDTVGEVESKVSDMGGVANVVIALTDGFTLLVWRATGQETSPVRADGQVDVHEDSEIDVLRLWLEAYDGGAVVLNLVRSTVSQPRELSYQF